MKQITQFFLEGENPTLILFSEKNYKKQTHIFYQKNLLVLILENNQT